ncbi:uncharacterized protein LOC5515068 isoform X2 [Nematostella vectensis]|nr:uncharacterized protein LOC5515068 isoform X2 [Nematostella vectensis]
MATKTGNRYKEYDASQECNSIRAEMNSTEVAFSEGKLESHVNAQRRAFPTIAKPQRRKRPKAIDDKSKAETNFINPNKRLKPGASSTENPVDTLSKANQTDIDPINTHRYISTIEDASNFNNIADKDLLSTGITHVFNLSSNSTTMTNSSFNISTSPTIYPFNRLDSSSHTIGVMTRGGAFSSSSSTPLTFTHGPVKSLTTQIQELQASIDSHNVALYEIRQELFKTNQNLRFILNNQQNILKELRLSSPNPVQPNTSAVHQSNGDRSLEGGTFLGVQGVGIREPERGEWQGRRPHISDAELQSLRGEKRKKPENLAVVLLRRLTTRQEREGRTVCGFGGSGLDNDVVQDIRRYFYRALPDFPQDKWGQCISAMNSYLRGTRRKRQRVPIGNNS